MRCKNCGWINSDGNICCEKCNSQLSSADKCNSSKDVTAEDTGNKSRLSVGYTSKPVEVLSLCSKCGYPMRPGTTRCPSCGFQCGIAESPVLENKQLQSPVCDEQSRRSPVVISSGTMYDSLFSDTNYPNCTLKPITWMNEGIERGLIPLSGENIPLTRANTDPDNITISASNHALISCDHGAWFIDGINGDTFVKVTRKMELENGDIIVLGNRMFRFNK